MTEPEKPIRILFICLGNIVRSPLAEALFNHHAARAELDGKYLVDSAGTSWEHIGETPDHRMLKVAAKHGLHYSHQSRQVKRQDLDDFDLLVSMDMNNYNYLLSMTESPETREKIHLLREWDPLSMGNQSVPDPYYGGREGFEEVFAVIDRSIRQLVNQLKNGNS